MTIYDFSLPFDRIKRRCLNFDHFRFFCEGAPTQYKNIIEPPRNRIGYDMQRLKYIEDVFILNEEKTTKKYILTQQKGLTC